MFVGNFHSTCKTVKSEENIDIAIRNGWKTDWDEGELRNETPLAAYNNEDVYGVLHSFVQLIFPALFSLCGGRTASEPGSPETPKFDLRGVPLLPPDHMSLAQSGGLQDISLAHPPTMLVLQLSTTNTLFAFHDLTTIISDRYPLDSIS